jgi:hypothetical protein
VVATQSLLTLQDNLADVGHGVTMVANPAWPTWRHAGHVGEPVATCDAAPVRSPVATAGRPQPCRLDPASDRRQGRGMGRRNHNWDPHPFGAVYRPG